MRRKVNEVHQLTGVSRRTLQYYDDKGVLCVERSEDNYRLYDEKALEKLWQILIYKEAGFELEEIKEIFTVSEQEKNRYLEKQIGVITEKIQDEKVKIYIINMLQNGELSKAPLENEGGENIFKKCITEIKERLKNKM